MARSIPEATIAIGRIRSMPMGKARAEAAAREVKNIELEGPDEVRAYALESLVEALTWCGEPMKAMVPFVKLLRWWDEHPDLFDQGDQNILFWEFGWIVGDLARTASVPTARVDASLDDMERRFSLASRGMERVWNNRMEWALIRHSPDLDQVYTTWLSLPIDDEDSCAACHPEHQAEYLIDAGRMDEAIAVLEAGIDSELTCSREPASMLAILTRCYMATGRQNDAEDLLPRTLAEIGQSASLSTMLAHANLFEVYGRGCKPKEALEHLSSFAEGLDTFTQYTTLDAMRYYIAGATCLVEWGYDDHPVNESHIPVSTIGELLAWLNEKADDLTEQFDQRHGNTVQAGRLAKARATKVSTRRLSMLGTIAAKAKYAGVPVSQLTAAVADESDFAPHTGVRVEELRQQAEVLAKEERWLDASQRYVAAANQAQDQGLLAQAGWAWAEAAHIVQVWDNDTDCSFGYNQALTRLHAAGASFEDVVPVLAAWAPAVTSESYQQFMTFAAMDYPTPAKPSNGDDVEKLLKRIINPAMIGSPLLRRYILAWASLKDAEARVMATFGGEADVRGAQALAQEAASRFSMLGRTLDAAHAWWLAGRLAVKLGETDDVDPNYRLALDGFASGGDVGADTRHEVAIEYRDILMNAGRVDDAKKMDEIIDEKEE